VAGCGQFSHTFSGVVYDFCNVSPEYFGTVSLDDTEHEFCYFGLLLEGTGKPGYQIVMLFIALTCTLFCSIDIYNFLGCFMDENFKNF
jgi:hypothetical protein